MSPSVFHCHCLKVKSSTTDMYHGHQIIDPNHRSVDSGSEHVIPANAAITASLGSLFWEDSSISSNADLRFSYQSHRQRSRIFPCASSSDFLPRPCPRQNVNTYDLLFSPSLLKSSIILIISFLPSLASTFFPPRLILTFSSARTCNSLFINKCRIFRHTKTPQSDPFSCSGLSARLMKFSGLFSK